MPGQARACRAASIDAAMDRTWSLTAVRPIIVVQFGHRLVDGDHRLPGPVLAGLGLWLGLGGRCTGRGPLPRRPRSGRCEAAARRARRRGACAPPGRGPPTGPVRGPVTVSGPARPSSRGAAGDEGQPWGAARAPPRACCLAAHAASCQALASRQPSTASGEQPGQRRADDGRLGGQSQRITATAARSSSAHATVRHGTNQRPSAPACAAATTANGSTNSGKMQGAVPAGQPWGGSRPGPRRPPIAWPRTLRCPAQIANGA